MIFSLSSLFQLWGMMCIVFRTLEEFILSFRRQNFRGQNCPYTTLGNLEAPGHQCWVNLDPLGTRLLGNSRETVVV